MPVFRCAYCGKEFQGSRSKQVYCSRSCSNRGRGVGISARCTPVPQKKFHDCEFNPGVACFPAGDCSKCGWNPTVSEHRMTRTLAKVLGVEVLTYDS